VIVLLLIVAGLGLLIIGGELLVRGSVRTAERLGVSPLLIGLTLVGFGTSTPELVTSVQAGLIGSPGIAVGNIIGSNIANVLLIIGLCALISPLAVEAGSLRRDGAVMIAVSLLFVLLAWTLGLTRIVGVGLLTLLIVYLVTAYLQERRAAGGHSAAYERAEAAEGVDPGLRPAAPKPGLGAMLGAPALALVGLGLILVGGRLFVDGAVQLARLSGISEPVIGLTIVAVGTSMPELVTSAVAAFRKQSAVALGNIIGSNIYNLLGIGGVTALIAPTKIPESFLWVDLPVMILSAGALILFGSTGARIGRREGAVLLGAYIAYVVYALVA